uniref:Uncharacterized protein n=1 Tax=Panagrolaimus superbus TaxID=310955 RepID=A0A914YNE2_9BILA
MAGDAIDQDVHGIHAVRHAHRLRGRPAGDSQRGVAVALPDLLCRAGRGVLPGRLGHPRLRIGGLRGPAGLRQRDDVAGDLPAGDPWPGPLHRDRLGPAGDGHRRRRDHSAAVRRAQAAHRLPAGVRPADGAVLPVHPVLFGDRPSRRPAAGQGLIGDDGRQPTPGKTHAQSDHQGRCGEGQGLAEDGLAGDQQRAFGDAGHPCAGAACHRRTRLRARSVRAQPAQRHHLRDRAGLRQPEPVPHHRRAERRAGRVPRDRFRPADPSLRFQLAAAGR